MASLTDIDQVLALRMASLTDIDRLHCIWQTAFDKLHLTRHVSQRSPWLFDCLLFILSILIHIHSWMKVNDVHTQICDQFVNKRDCRNECLAQEMSGGHRFVNNLDNRDCRSECLALSHDLEIPTRMTPKWCYIDDTTDVPPRSCAPCYVTRTWFRV